MESAIEPVAEIKEKRRYRTVEERRRIVEETLADGVSVAVVARRNGVNANQVLPHSTKLRPRFVAGLPKNVARCARRGQALDRRDAQLAEDLVVPASAEV